MNERHRPSNSQQPFHVPTFRLCFRHFRPTQEQVDAAKKTILPACREKDFFSFSFSFLLTFVRLHAPAELIGIYAVDPSARQLMMNKGK